MATLPSPPFIKIEGISNFRDIGGTLTQDGKKIKRGLVFRSADPSKPTDDGRKKMSEELGIKVIFDLRSTPEIKRDGPEWSGLEVANDDLYRASGIERRWTPVFADKDYGPEQVAVRYKDYTATGTEGWVRAYHDILKDGRGAYGKIFTHLASERPEPCLINCTAGKDRTGVCIALLLQLAGVDAERTADEYALTDQGLAELKPFFVERLLKNPAISDNEEGVWRMVSAKKENMLAALEMLRNDFGGAEEYMVKTCGLSAAQVEQMKRNLVDA